MMLGTEWLRRCITPSLHHSDTPFLHHANTDSKNFPLPVREVIAKDSRR
jgi:hypothetical protein